MLYYVYIFVLNFFNWILCIFGTHTHTNTNIKHMHFLKISASEQCVLLLFVAFKTEYWMWRDQVNISCTFFFALKWKLNNCYPFIQYINNFNLHRILNSTHYPLNFRVVKQKNCCKPNIMSIQFNSIFIKINKRKSNVTLNNLCMKSRENEKEKTQEQTIFCFFFFFFFFAGNVWLLPITRLSIDI